MPGDHGLEIDGDQAFVAELIRHVAFDDALGEAFDDGGFADAGFADEHRIVLGAAAENLHDASDFIVAADDGIELAAFGLLGQIDGVAFERLIFALRILICDALRATHGHQSFEDGVFGGALAIQDGSGGIVLLIRDSEQKVFSGDEFVLKTFGRFGGCFENLLEAGRDELASRLSGNFGETGELRRWASCSTPSGWRPHFSRTGRTMPSRSAVRARSKWRGLTA